MQQFQGQMPQQHQQRDIMMGSGTPMGGTPMGGTPMGTPGAMGTPGMGTPGMGMGSTPQGYGGTPMGAAPGEKQVIQSSSSLEGMNNLMSRINEFGALMQNGDMINEQIISSEKAPQSQEMEIFINGGSSAYQYKKAALDFSKMQGSADGAIMLRVNCPVIDGNTYQI